MLDGIVGAAAGGAAVRLSEGPDRGADEPDQRHRGVPHRAVEARWFLRAIRRGSSGRSKQRAVFDFLGHPSCLYVIDPEFKTIDLICDLVEQAGPRARFADLSEISDRK